MLQTKPKIDNIYGRLNFMEQKLLKDYIENQISILRLALAGEYQQYKIDKDKECETFKKIVEDHVQKVSHGAWDLMDRCMTTAMRESKISVERINKVMDRLSELMAAYKDEIQYIKTGDKVLHGADFVCMNKDELFDIITELIDKNCKGCTSSGKDCNCHKLLDKYNTPVPTGFNGRCKYAY